MEQQARRSAPSSVSAQERAAIRQQSAAWKKEYEAGITQAEKTTRRKRDQLQQQVNSEKQQHQTAAQRQRAVLVQRQAQLADASTTHDRLVTQLATAEKEHRRTVGLRRHLRFVTTGH